MDENQSSGDSNRRQLMYAFGVYSGVGMQLVISVVVGIFAGQWLDEKLGTGPWLMIIGLLLGTVAGFYNLIRILNNFQKKKQDNE